MAAGWSDASWNGTYNYTNYTNDAPVHAGIASISASITIGYGALSVQHSTGIPAGSYTSAVFWINGGTIGSGVRQLQVLVWANASPSGEPPFRINVLPDQWTQVVVPLSTVGSPTTITQISIQDTTDGLEPTFYVDNLCLSMTLPPPPPAGCDAPIYLEALVPNWQNASWNGTYNFAEAAPSPVYAGSFSIGATITASYGALLVKHNVGISTGSYTSIVFWIHGGTSSTRQLQVIAQVGSSYNVEPPVNVDAPSNQWTQVVIPLSALGSPSTITQINIQDRTNNPQRTFYVENVCLSALLLPPPPPPPPPPGPPPGRFPGVPGCAYTLYDDALADGWDDWSWNSNINRGHPYALSGQSLAWQYREGYAGLSMRSPQPLPGQDYDAVSFWINGGEDPGTRQAVKHLKQYGGFSLRLRAPLDAGQYSGIVFRVHGGDQRSRQMQVWIQEADDGGDSKKVAFELRGGEWQEIVVPLSSLGNPKAIKRINIQDLSAKPQTFYLDSLYIAREASAGASLPVIPAAQAQPTPAAPAAQPVGTLTIYGDALAAGWENWSWNTQVNFANAQLALCRRAIAVRYGGAIRRLLAARAGPD